MKRHGVAGMVAAALLVGNLGCYGSFAAVRRVHEFNGSVTEVKFVHTLVMYAFVMLPVYSLATAADVLVLNAIEFWTGNNPLGAAEVPKGDTRLAKADAESVMLTRGGHRYEIQPLDAHRVAVVVDGRRVGITTVNDDGSMEMADASGVVFRRISAGEAQALRAATEPLVPTI